MYKNCNMLNHQCDQNNNVLEEICNNVAILQDYNQNNCNCGFDEDENVFPSNPMYGNSYVPNQLLKTTFMPEVALKLGTLYPELVSPYMPGQSMAEMDFLRKTNSIKEGCNNE